MKKLKLLVSSAALGSLFLATSALSATFQTPKNFNIIMLDGEKTSNFFTSTKEVTLDEGKHQIVVLFKGNFRKGRDQILTSASNPIVINIKDTKKDDAYTFNYKRIKNYDEAVDFSENQVINITNNNKPVSSEEVGYFILQSDSGFQLDRDFKRELQSLGLLYVSPKNQIKEEKENKTMSDCRNSDMTNCPHVVVSNKNAVIPAENSVQVSNVLATNDANNISNNDKTKFEVAKETNKSVAQTNLKNVNENTLNGLKAIYQGADANTRAAFLQWISTQK